MNNKIYSDDYKHFDNIIWQVPIWSLAFFTAISIGIGSDQLSSELKLFSLLFSVILIVLFSFYLYRCRLYQAYTDFYTPIEIETMKFNNLPIGAQFCLQLSITMEYSSLFIIFINKLYFYIYNSYLELSILEYGLAFLAFILLSILITFTYEHNIKTRREDVGEIKSIFVSIKKQGQETTGSGTES